MKSNAQKLYPVLMSSRFDNYSTQINLHVLPSISNYLPSQPLKSNLKVPEFIKDQLADPDYGVPGEIHLLLGAEIFYDLFIGEKFDVGNNLTFHKTVLGWVLTGKVTGNQFSHIEAPVYTCFNEGRVDSVLSLFASNLNKYRSDEQTVENHFKHTHYRDESGRFVVRLPFSGDVDALGNSSYMAQRRFFNLEKRLCKDKELSTAYHKFMSEYIHILIHESHGVSK